MKGPAARFRSASAPVSRAANRGLAEGAVVSAWLGGVGLPWMGSHF